MQKSSVFFGILIIGLLLVTRFWNLTGLPPSPYEEEVALGYDAYSIWKTGKDHHGNPYPLLALQSFGDWKPALYAYAIIPFLPVFDLSVLAVRLPSAIAGASLLISIIAIGRYIGIRWKWTSLVAVTSPWLILFSRAAWEVNLATACITGAMALFLWQSRWEKLPRRGIAILVASALLIASAYTYHAARVVVPLVLPGLVVWSVWGELSEWKTLWKKRKFTTKVVSSLLTLSLSGLVVLGIVPLLLNARNNVVSQRALETSYVGTPALLEKSLALQAADGGGFWSRKLFNPYTLYAREFTTNYLVHLSPRFLFIDGDSNPRHSAQFTGLLYWLDAVVLFAGILWMWRHFDKTKALLLWCLLVALVPVAITKDVPHALRILPAAPVFLLTISAGYQWLTEHMGNSKAIGRWVAPASVGIILLQFVAFWWFYTKIYPIAYATSWHTGIEEAVRVVQPYAEKGTFIYLDTSLNRRLMFYWFFTKTDPNQVQEVARTVAGETTEFNHVHTGAPELFPAVYVTDSQKPAPPGARLINSVSRLQPGYAWNIYEL